MADSPPPDGGTAVIATNAQGDRCWERAWTLDELRKGASNWHLAGDAGLLLYLQEFSQKLMSRTHEIEKAVDNLVHDSKLAGVRVNNVFNDFMMLANTQFVENRVYDDEVHNEDQNPAEERKQDNKEKTREQREAELIPKVSEAIKLGVEVIEKAFDKLDVENSDSEEEDESYRIDPILEAKDPYIHRTLPHLIGSPNFMNDDNVGLKDDISEESDAGSISESEESDVEEEEDGHALRKDSYSYSETESESSTETDKKGQRIKEPQVQSSDEDSSEGDMFETVKKSEEVESGTEESDEDEAGKIKKPPSEPLDFASELSRKLGGGVPKPSFPKAAEDIKKEKRKKKDNKDDSKKKVVKNNSDDDLFGQSDNSDNEDLFGGGTFGTKTSGSIFDNKDEDDLFGETKEPKLADNKIPEQEKDEGLVEENAKNKQRDRTVSGRKVPIGGVSVFGAPAGQKLPATGSGGGLFDEDDDDDDIFKSPKISKPSEEQTDKKALAADNDGLFDNQNSDGLFGDAQKVIEQEEEPKKVEPPAKKRPIGGVSMFGPPGGVNPLVESFKNKTKGQVSEEEDKGRDSRSSSVKSDQLDTAKPAAKVTSNPSKDSLFLSEPDDTDVTTVKSNVSNTKVTSNLFVDDEDEDDLFGSAKTTQSAAKKAHPAVAKIDNKPTTKASTLFISDDEDDLFGSATAPKAKEIEKKKPAGVVSVLPTGKEPEEKKAELPKKDEPVSRPPSKSISIFDDDDEDKLFMKKSTPPKDTGTATKKSIFDDGDLFGGEPEDIFTKPLAKSVPPESKPPAKSLSAEAKKPGTKETKVNKGPTLFEDDEGEDDDLFGSVVKRSSKESKPTTQLDNAAADTSDIQEKETQPDVKTKKPPVGGVSVFGPSTGQTLKEPKVIEHVVEVSVQKPEPRKPRVDPLFGGNDDDDDDDLFAAPAKKIDVKKTEPVKKEVKKTKEPFKNNNEDLFTRVDVTMKGPLTDVIEKGPLDDDVPQKEPIDIPQKGPLDVPQKEPLDIPQKGPLEDVLNKESEIKKSPMGAKTKKPIGGVSLFGDVDPFAAVKKKQIEQNNSEKVASSPEEDLFGSPDKPESPIEVKPKKPVGGVSMFGGLDPSISVKEKQSKLKKNDDVSTSPKEDLFDTSVEKPNITMPKLPSMSDSRPTSTVSDGASVSSLPVIGKIGKLQATLNFNPAALLPGAAPPIREPESVKIGFDIPAAVKTLPNANKDRAKIQSKRRPPTRPARKSSAGDTLTDNTMDLFAAESGTLSPVDMDFDGDDSRVPPPISDMTDEVLDFTNNQHSDLFENEDVFGSKFLDRDGISNKIEKHSHSDAVENSPDDIFSERKFDFPKAKTKPEGMDNLFIASSKDVSKNNDTKDKDSGSSDKDATFKDDIDILAAPTKTTKKSGKTSRSSPDVGKDVEDDNDVLFKSVPTMSKKSDKVETVEKKSVTLEKDENIFEVKKTKAKAKPSPIIEDDDDLFSSPSLAKTQDRSKVEKQDITLSHETTSANKDADDIFADSSLNKRKEVPQKTEAHADTKLPADTELPAVDEDDIFANAKVAKKKTKKAVSKDEDIFDDKTDIFNDLPKAKPKEKKTKKKTTPATKKTIFKDDIDDIFADTSTAAKPREKKKTTNKNTDDKTKPAEIGSNPLMS